LIVQLLLLQSLLTNSYSLDTYIHASEIIVNNSVKCLFIDDVLFTTSGSNKESRENSLLLISLLKAENGYWHLSQFNPIKKSENILDAVDVIIKDECPSLRVGLKWHFY
jgi:hypothetical protein